MGTSVFWPQIATGPVVHSWNFTVRWIVAAGLSLMNPLGTACWQVTRIFPNANSCRPMLTPLSCNGNGYGSPLPLTLLAVNGGAVVSVASTGAANTPRAHAAKASPSAVLALLILLRPPSRLYTLAYICTCRLQVLTIRG